MRSLGVGLCVFMAYAFWSGVGLQVYEVKKINSIFAKRYFVPWQATLTVSGMIGQKTLFVDGSESLLEARLPTIFGDLIVNRLPPVVLRLATSSWRFLIVCQIATLTLATMKEPFWPVE